MSQMMQPPPEQQRAAAAQRARQLARQRAAQRPAGRVETRPAYAYIPRSVLRPLLRVDPMVWATLGAFMLAAVVYFMAEVAMGLEPITEQVRWQRTESEWARNGDMSEQWRWEHQYRAEKQWERDQGTLWTENDRARQTTQYWQEQRRP